MTTLWKCGCSQIAFASSVETNNAGVNCLQAGNFNKAIRCFHEALIFSRQSVLGERNIQDAPQYSLMKPVDTTTGPCSICSSPRPVRQACLQSSSTELSVSRGDAHASSLNLASILDDDRIYYEPLRMERKVHSQQQPDALICPPTTTPCSTRDRNVEQSLSISTIILNTAIAYHLQGNTISPVEKNCQERQYLRKAKVMYEKALQLLMMNVDQEGLDHISGTQREIVDLVLMAALNNLVLLMAHNPTDQNLSMYIECLIARATDSNSRTICISDSATTIGRCLRKWQTTFLSNALAMKSYTRSAAAAA